MAVRRRHRDARAAGRGLVAAGLPAAAGRPPLGPADGVHVRPAGRRAVLLRRPPAPRRLARLPGGQQGQGQRQQASHQQARPSPLVGAGRHGRHRRSLHRLAAGRTYRADHLPPRSRHLPPGRLLDRAPRLPAHTRLGGRVRRPAPGPGLRQLQLLPARHGHRAPVHDRGPAHPRRGNLAPRHQRRPAGHARDRRVRGALVRRPGRAAGRPRLGPGRRGRAGAEPARAVHQPRLVQRAAGPGAAVRRPLPAGRLARRQQKHQDQTGPARTRCWPRWRGSRSG